MLLQLQPKNEIFNAKATRTFFLSMTKITPLWNRQVVRDYFSPHLHWITYPSCLRRQRQTQISTVRYWTHFYDLGHWIFESCWLDCGSFEEENEEKEANGEENAAEARENEEENEKKKLQPGSKKDFAKSWKMNKLR